MATNVATLTATLEADTRKFNREIGKAERNLQDLDGTTAKAQKSQGRLDRSIGGTGVTMRQVFGGAAGAAALAFMKDSVREASNLNESINAVEKTFGPAADGVLALGENAAQSVGLANSEFNQLAVGFGAFVENIDQGRGQTVGIMDDLTTRIADFASVMNLDVPEAAEKFRSGLAGETEPLRKFGIDVSAAAVSTKALELGLADSTSELSEQDKVLARYELIMEQTDKTAGDFADTQDDFANATRTAQAELKDFQAFIGTQMLPFIGKLVAAGSDLIQVFDGIARAIPGVESAGELFADAFDFLTLGIFDSLDQLSSWFEETPPLSEAAARAIEEAGAASGSSAAEHEINASGIEHVAEASGSSAGEVEVMTGALEDAEDQSEDTAGEILTAAEAIEELINATRRYTSPAFRLLDDTRQLQEAHANYDEVLGDSSSTMADIEEALFDLLAAEEAVNVATIEYADVAGPQAVQAFLDLAREAGVTGDELQFIEDRLNELNGQTFKAQLDIAIATSGETDVVRFDGGQVRTGAGGGGFGGITRQHGGPFTANQPMIVGERGPELVQFDRSGMVEPRVTASGGSQELHFNFSGVIGSQIQLQQWIREALEESRRISAG